MELFFSVFAALFTVVNPFGAVPLFLAMTADHSRNERISTIKKTSLYFLGISVIFYFVGTYIFNFFGINLFSLKVAGGIVILTSGLSLLKGKFAESRSINKKVTAEALEREDISFSPLAMPLLSGPGSIALLISYYAQNPSWDAKLIILTAIFATSILVFTILRLSPHLLSVLGLGGLRAVSRIMGIISMSVGIQYIVSGLVGLAKVFL